MVSAVRRSTPRSPSCADAPDHPSPRRLMTVKCGARSPDDARSKISRHRSLHRFWISRNLALRLASSSNDFEGPSFSVSGALIPPVLTA